MSGGHTESHSEMVLERGDIYWQNRRPVASTPFAFYLLGRTRVANWLGLVQLLGVALRVTLKASPSGTNEQPRAKAVY